MRVSLRADDEGFNILELVVVVAVLGIITAIAFATYSFSVQHVRSITCRANQRVLDDAARVYEADQGRFPDDIEGLRPYANTFDTVTHCPSDFNTLLTWNATTNEIECALHPR